VSEGFIVFAEVAHHESHRVLLLFHPLLHQSVADRLCASVQNKGMRCWFAPHDVQGGRKLHEQIDEAISACTTSCG